MNMQSNNGTRSPSPQSAPREVRAFRFFTTVSDVEHAIHRYKWTSECNETIIHGLHLQNLYPARYAFCRIVTIINFELPLGANEWRRTRRRYPSAPTCAVRASRGMGFSGRYYRFLLMRNLIHRCKLIAMMRYRLRIYSQHPTRYEFIIPYLCQAELAFIGTDGRQLAGQLTSPDRK
jgi:hypothetical protein